MSQLSTASFISAGITTITTTHNTSSDATITISNNTMQLLTEAISHYIPDSDIPLVVFSPTTGGVNNVVYYVHVRRILTGVLRVYNNGNDDAKVTYEHAVLTQLHKEKLSLSFFIPEPMPLLTPTSSTTTTFLPHQYVKLSTGASAALFRPIKGRLPGTVCVRHLSSKIHILSYKPILLYTYTH